MKNPSFFVSPIGRAVWEDRYALRDVDGKLLENDITETFRRVAKAVASKEKDAEGWENRFYELMVGKYFCPGGRILAHAGTHFSQLFNCYVIPFEDDSLESIMDTAKAMAVTQKFGGGTGFNYSRLRPSGSYIKGVNGRSCGVLGFIDMMSVISGIIEQGGSRRGANMGILEIFHPDVWEFISYKTDHNWDRLRDFMDVKDEEKWASFKFENPYKLQMYNVSIGVTDDFLDAVDRDEEWPLKWKDAEWQLCTTVYTRRNHDGSVKSLSFDVTACDDATAIWKVKKKVPFPGAQDTFEVTSRRRLRAREIWEKLCYNAWADGCPGLINFSTARNFHNIEYAHPIEASNPCGEQLLSAYSVCDLGSLVLPSFVETVEGKKAINRVKLREAVEHAVRFLDDVTDNCAFPLPQFQEAALSERRVGVGTMGLHDMLIALELDYDSEEGRAVVADLLEFIRNEAYRASIALAKEKGPFSLFERDKYLQSGFVQTLPLELQEGIKIHGMRNSTVLSQAPMGTIGAMYGCSTGCEPWFALSFQRNSRLGSFEDGCPAYIEWKKAHEGTPPSYFKTAQEIDPKDHLAMLVLFSKYVDSSISKTINLSSTATVKDISDIFMTAMRSRVKGITIFRDGCKEGVLVNKDKQEQQDKGVLGDIEEGMLPGWKKRGNRTTGATTRIHMQDHNMYVTVNKNTHGSMVEVFAIVGESKDATTRQTSGVEDSWAEGLGKIISLALRAGVSPEAIIRNLKNIPSDKPTFTTLGGCETSELLPSPPHAIARVMEEEMEYTHMDMKQNKIEKKVFCKACGSSNVTRRSPTCYECLDCSYSGCG